MSLSNFETYGCTELSKGGDKVVPWILKIYTETLHCQYKTNQYDIMKVAVMA